MFDKISKVINPDMDITELKKIIISNDELKKEYSELINKYYGELKSGKKFEIILNEIKEANLNKNLFEKFSKDFKEHCAAYIETEFLRNGKFDDIKIKIDFVFENMIINRSFINELINESDITASDFMYTLKFLNTINNFIIVKHYTKIAFQKEAEYYFEIGKDLLNYLWDLFNKHKTELSMIYLIEKIGLIEKGIDNIYCIFENLISEDED